MRLTKRWCMCLWLGLLGMASLAQGETGVSFRVNIDDMMPQRYQSRRVSYGYSLEVRNDSVLCYLPYMGQVQLPEFDNRGLDFQVPILALKSKKDKKGRYELKMACKRNSVVYNFRITIYPGGRCYIRLYPSNADSIAYEGDIES